MVYQELIDWAKENGATLNDAVTINHSPESGARFVATANVPRSAPIVSCPMNLTLSYLNLLTPPPAPFRDPYAGASSAPPPSTVANVPFPPAFLANTPPHVLSRFLLMQQYLLGHSSFWHAYIAALPVPGSLDLPALWADDDAELLDGTNLATSIADIRQQLAAEYAAARALLQGWSAGSWREFTRDLYFWAYAVFTSRSFTPTLVIPDEQTVGERLPPGVKMTDFSLLLPLYDIGNHGMMAPITWARDAETQNVTLCVDREHREGEEVFNNYGMKTNAQLLVAYGFMIAESEDLHNDYVHQRKRNAAAEQGGVKHDYVFSLYPAQDKRSRLLAERQMILPRRLAEITSTHTLSSFARVQDDLVWDIVLQQVPVQQLATILGLAETATEQTPEKTREAMLAKLLTGDVPKEIKPVLLRTMAVIQNQALRDLEALEETDVEVHEEDVPNLTKCQQLALEYRGRCRKVLEAVLEAMDVSPVEDEEE
ncbi:hypothetical protein TD95_004336 [Thielaviopsis punctulata]|uniref:SET domain-containing protein n=1 Tax=Thielaviopsis punctulata TaxID=72032 RepID=A0A0F4ZLC4_9PEZI|nr:hypothetical protein TD95_004336 [Thielaviopsis punctulata]